MKFSATVSHQTLLAGTQVRAKVQQYRLQMRDWQLLARAYS